MPIDIKEPLSPDSNSDATLDIKFPPPPPPPPRSAVSSLQAPPPDLDLRKVMQDYITDEPGHLSVRKGDRIFILSTSANGDWCMGFNPSEKVGWLPKSYTAKLYSLTAYSWYHGEISDLMAKGVHSDNITKRSHFFVQKNEGRPNAYAIIVYNETKTFEFPIYYNTESSILYIHSRTGFLNLSQLVAHYSKNPDELQSTLGQPIPNKCMSTSS